MVRALLKFLLPILKSPRRADWGSQHALGEGVVCDFFSDGVPFDFAGGLHCDVEQVANCTGTVSDFGGGYCSAS